MKSSLSNVCVKIALTLLMTLTVSAVASASLFPTDLPTSEWADFKAHGFNNPVTGVIYRYDARAVCGLSLGGVATGCIDLETDGVWGWSSLVNPKSSFAYNQAWRMPRKLPQTEPVLGLSVGGKTWVMAKKQYIDGSKFQWPMEPHLPGAWVPEAIDQWLQNRQLSGVEPASEIHYWGHYPVADMVYDTDAPVNVAMRAWSPFLPGDTSGSGIPAAVFEVHLSNNSPSSQKGTIAFNFPGPDTEEAKSATFTREPIKDNVEGVLITGAADVNYFIGVMGNENARFGAGLSGGATGKQDHGFKDYLEKIKRYTPPVNDQWSKIATELPSPDFGFENGKKVYQDASGSAAVDFELGGGESKVVRFLLSWYCPIWEGGNKGVSGAQPQIDWNAPDWLGNQLYYKQMYAKRYSNALDIARRMVADHEQLLARILAWQNVLYTDQQIPGWLADSLINNLCLITETSYWAQPLPPLGDWAHPLGVFVMNESSRGCPHVCCIPCDWYGGLPITYFYPDLALSMMRAFKQYQRPDGEVPFALGKIGDLPDVASPEFFWQKSLNGMCYIDLVSRLWLRTNDDTIVDEFYDSLKSCHNFMMKLSSKPGYPIRMPDDGGMEWFEHGEWAGMATHMGGLRLAMIKMMENFARNQGDSDYVKQCQNWFEIGSTAMEEKMWAGSYYLNFWEPETKRKSDDVMAYQLDGEWAAKFHGLGGVFQADRVRKTLETVTRCNVALTPDIGAANFVRPDGQALGKKGDKGTLTETHEGEDIAHYGTHSMFVAEAVLLGMTYMYAGQEEYGLEFIRKHWHNLICRQGLAWDYPNMVHGLTGERIFGTDYYQAMMLWALPAQLTGKDLTTLSAPGGLLDRMITAAKVR